MKRMKTRAIRALAVACMAALLAFATGCSSQQTYTPPEPTPTLSAPTIAQEGILRVGVNADSAPLAGQPSSSSKIVGIDVDVAAALADSLGLKIEVVDVGTDPETALVNGDVDIVMGADKADKTTTFWKSDAYIPTGVALFSTSAGAEVPTDAAQPQIAAQVSSKSAWAVTNEFENSVLTTTDDLKGAFAALASGQVQYVAADAVIGTYAAHSAGDEVGIVALMEQPGGLSVGVLDANAELKQAVSDALTTLSGNGVIAVIEKKWLGTAIDLATVPLTAGATASSTSTADTDVNDADAAGGTEGDADPALAGGDGTGESSAEGTDAGGVEAGSNAVQPNNAAA